MQQASTLSRRHLLALIAAGMSGSVRSARAEPAVVLVHKDPQCGCCTGWVEHLQSADFTVDVRDSADLSAVRTRLHVPANLSACHTAEVSGYVVEGHVPAAAIVRLLQTRPVALGLAVPGMPAGSPGMEGGQPEPYDVVLFAADGQRAFMRFVGTKEVG